ncbi:S-type anion channel SLAH4-like [Humulus lupulus]|uniref:S-type anion channel SLAH4-like n=1 Tax=Humulus lupulus TaxID=3486 RepID=UPI002B411CAE|nr:S-type anion channel SLAH4-like [Humulus lupulus]
MSLMAVQSSESEIEQVIQSSLSSPVIISTNIINDQDYHRQQSLLTTVMIILMDRLSLNSLRSVLTKFHAGYFRISLSLGGQALLWKKFMGPTTHDMKMTSSASTTVINALHPTSIFLVLWSFALFTLILLSLIYLLKCLFYFKMVKAEFLHHVGVNYLFVPWISWLLLLQTAPFLGPRTATYLILWWIFSVPVVLLDVKIYGQWFTKGKRYLSMAANPTSQLSVIGNLVGAQAAAQMGWRESAVGLFSLGMVHYLVLFVTLYQRLAGGDRLPAMLRPVFFLFFAAPSMASLAWESIVGAFDMVSKMLFFLSLFLFLSLICRPTLFKRSMRRFNIAWWAYSFPMTVLALASFDYAEEVKGGIARILMFFLFGLSVLVSLGLVATTIINRKMLLPDDDPITTTLFHSNLLPLVSTTTRRRHQYQ